MVFLNFKHCEGYNHCSSGRTFFFWRLRRWWITCWKSNIFIRKNYFVFIIYAQIYLQNFKTFDAILFILNLQNHLFSGAKKMQKNRFFKILTRSAPLKHENTPFLILTDWNWLYDEYVSSKDFCINFHGGN